MLEILPMSNKTISHPLLICASIFNTASSLMKYETHIKTEYINAIQDEQNIQDLVGMFIKTVVPVIFSQ